MTRQELAVELICNFESFRSHSYLDSVGKLTIGYGTIFYPDGRAVKKGDNCTINQAKGWLEFHLEKHVYPSIIPLDKGQIPDKVYAAIASIAYNEGEGILLLPSFKIPISSNDWGTLDEDTLEATGLAATFLMYDKITINGKKVPNKGLKNRRIAEIKYFLDR